MARNNLEQLVLVTTCLEGQFKKNCPSAVWKMLKLPE